MLPQEIIRRKRDGNELSELELTNFFGAFQSGQVADYQMSAFLMAVYWRGMSPEETVALTRIMRDSGEMLVWPWKPREVVDKHSTGGVGDKTSLVLLPLMLLEGLKVPMMAGRGLGHTGGTLDKLESIPGMNVYPHPDAVRRQMDQLGGVFMGQTSQVAPLDKRLYALRDVTSTVESIPLITGSILSKKLAEGIGGLVMDVKFGSGAFMREKSDAEKLAKTIAATGRLCGLHTTCLLTSMDSPLGDRAGNALEVIECIEIMRGAGPSSTVDLTIALAVEMLALGGRCDVSDPQSIAASENRLRKNLKSGAAFELFKKVVALQGGDVTWLDDPRKFPKAPVIKALVAERDGVIQSIDVRALGIAIQLLGGGRRLVTDKIDPRVGLAGLRQQGDRVSKGDPLVEIHARSDQEWNEAARILRQAHVVSDSGGKCDLVWKRIGAEAV
jgi:thymidine phosphorylase